MTTQTRSEAQTRADEIRVFRRELERLEHAGLLTLSDSQRQAVAAYHDELLTGYVKAFDIDCDVKGKQLSLGMRTASFLGALALAASVFFLFYQFWGWFSTTQQVATLLFAPLCALAITAFIQGRDASGYFTKLAAMVTFACFVLNIAMLGQIFNITPSDKALLPWGAFALLLAYCCELRLLLVAAILCAVAFIAARVGTWSGIYWLSVGERPENFFPAALALFLVPQFIRHERFSGFAETYRISALLTLLLPTLVLAHWGAGSYLDIDRKVLEGFYQLFGFAASAGAIWLGTRRNWGEVFNTGVVFFVIFLYTKFYDWWWEIMPKYLFFMIVGLSAVLLLLILKRLRVAARQPHEENRP
jgi:uncharacterized membrane protein